MSNEDRLTVERFRFAVEMCDSGIAMMRLRLEREHPGEGAQQIEQRLRAWLGERAGADHGRARVLR